MILAYEGCTRRRVQLGLVVSKRCVAGRLVGCPCHNQQDRYLILISARMSLTSYLTMPRLLSFVGNVKKGVFLVATY